MRWNSIKTVMIVILLGVNLWLVYLLAERSLAQNYFTADVLADAVEILGRDGIALTVDQLDPKKRDSAVYAAEMGEDYYTEVAALFTASPISETFPTPTGVRMIAENRDTISFTKAFGVNYLSAELDRSEIAEIARQAVQTGEALAPEQRALRTLRTALERYLYADTAEGGAVATVRAKLCFDAAYRYDGYCLFRCSQEIDGKKIDRHRVDCLFDSAGRLLWIDGTWSFLSLTRNYSAQLYDQINILFMEKASLDEWRTEAQSDAPMTLDRLESCYIQNLADDEQTGGSRVYYSPAWQIVYTDGTVRTYSAVTGEVVEAS